MKTYVLMTSLALAAGVSLGFWTGKGSAQTGFASGCAADGLVVVYDYQTEAHRHFHCFELDDLGAPEKPEEIAPRQWPGSSAVFAL
jgi:hypothetical protein